MISGKDFKKIKDELDETLSDILDNNPQLAQAREVKEVIDWYSKTKEGTVEPGKILQLINELILSKFSDKLSSELPTALEGKLRGIAIQKTLDGISVRIPLLEFDISTDVYLVANGTTNLAKLTITLKLKIEFAVENMKSPTEEEKKQIEIGRIVFYNDLIFFAKMMIGAKSIPVGHKEFELKDIVLSVM